MAAFERVRSGIPEMDQALDNIRLGDNVVWRVSDLEEFKSFASPYIKAAVEDQRQIVYIRFADHEPFITQEEADRDGIMIEHVELSHRFEDFTVRVHNIIEAAGYDAFYLFDCLSVLQTAWATDLMMGNFFRVTCPYLFSLDTVAFFPLIRGRHSLQAIAKIQDTTQLFLDVYSDDQAPDILYVRPEKVWNRYSETMFMPHMYDRERGSFRPILDGVRASRFYQVFGDMQRTGDEQNIDSWDRFFNTTKILQENGMDVTEQCNRICNIMMTRDPRMRVMIKKHFKPKDYFAIRNRMIGTGMIGGKACGMLLARKIIANKRRDLYRQMEPHDSFYVGSDVFYTYIVDNNFWDLRIRQRSEEGYFALANDFAERLMHGSFSSAMEERFRFVLDYYGQDPYIIRSSSILEDGFGNAFAGKYESVFCANTGTMEERLAEFENAARIVYASTMSLSALDYRKRRGLAGRDEQMSLLIQRVSGSHHGQYFMPCAAGVGYSYSPYRIREDMDPEQGMLRLVMGLGTSAVDRTEGSYPRIVNLSAPETSSASTSRERHQFSQRKVELINMKSKVIEQVNPEVITRLMPKAITKELLEHDYDAEQMFRERGQNRDVEFISCRGLVRNRELMGYFRDMLHLIEEEYQYPVDTEFTVNLSEKGEFVVNLLQCRPLQAFHDAGANETEEILPDVLDDEVVLLDVQGASMGMTRVTPLDYIVYVEPMGYYELPYQRKPDVARQIGKINWFFREKHKNVVLMVPGRVGTSSQELGVPTGFADISEFCCVCEVAAHGLGYDPELSYGSHIFQDLVEAQILYVAVFEGEKTKNFKPERLEKRDDSAGRILKDDPYGIVHVYDAKGLSLYHDMRCDETVIG